MKKRVWAASPFFYLVVIAMYLMAGASWFWDKRAFTIELGIAVVSTAVIMVSIAHFKSYVKTAYQSAETIYKSIDENVLEKFSVPLVVAGQAGDIIACNSTFVDKVCSQKSCAGDNILRYTQNKRMETFLNSSGEDVTVNGRQYTVFGVSLEKTVVLYYIDDTYFKETAKEYGESRPAVATVLFDNREELLHDATDGQDTRIVAAVESALQKWASATSGFLKKLSGGRYMVLLEERHVQEFKKNKFDILDDIRGIKLDERRWATISIGIGHGGESFKQCELWSRKALDMALGRGGDQVAIKEGDSYEFFGGVSKGVEKRDKVRTRVIAATLTDHIKQSDTVFIMGHKFSDLDAVGASIGMWSAVRKGQERDAYVVIDREQTLAKPLVESVENAGHSSMFISPLQALQLITDRSLLVIVDTHSQGFIESPELYEKAKRVVIIDHHRMMVNHISDAVIFYHEPYASSASEMVTELAQYLGENALSRLEAEALLSGIMLDTKNFVLKTGVRTFEAAAYLRRKGADTIEVKRMFSDSIDTYKAKYQLVSGAEIFNACAIACADESCPDIRVASAQAADELLGIQGVLASFVLYPTGDIINISARSLGEFNVQLIMEAMGGGGHQTMAGAQLENLSIAEAHDKLVEVINKADAERKKRLE